MLHVILCKTVSTLLEWYTHTHTFIGITFFFFIFRGLIILKLNYVKFTKYILQTIFYIFLVNIYLNKMISIYFFMWVSFHTKYHEFFFSPFISFILAIIILNRVLSPLNFFCVFTYILNICLLSFDFKFFWI